MVNTMITVEKYIFYNGNQNCWDLAIYQLYRGQEVEAGDDQIVCTRPGIWAKGILHRNRGCRLGGLNQLSS